MGTSSKQDLIAAARASAVTPDMVRRAEERARICDYIPCRERFTPVREHGRFCRPTCRAMANQHPNLDRKRNGQYRPPAATAEEQRPGPRRIK